MKTHVIKQTNYGGITIFKLEISLRFRKPTLLRNAETGHAPFKAIT